MKDDKRKKNKERINFIKHTSYNDECVLWPWSVDKDGYGRVSFMTQTRAHRASFLIHNGLMEVGKVICHSCDNPGCINPNHLFEATVHQNNTDRKIKGRNADVNGERHPMCKLSKIQVGVIMEAIRNGFKGRNIAKYFNIKESQISRIKHGLRWKSLT